MADHAEAQARSRLAPAVARLGLGALAFDGALFVSVGALFDEPWRTLLTRGLLAGGLALLVAAPLAPNGATRAKTRRGWRARLARSGYAVLLAALTLCALLTLALTGQTLARAGSSRQFYNSDAAAFNAYNAELVLHGVNPYTADARFWDATGRYPDAGATRLRRGRFAGASVEPDEARLVRDVQAQRQSPALRDGEFAPESLHSYPALAFLLYVPGVWLGLPTTALTSLAGVGALLLTAGWRAPRGARIACWLLLLANCLLIPATLRGSFEALAVLPVLLAWRALDRRRLSPLLLGLGCAVKQTVWLFVPFYLALVWRRQGPRAAAERGALALAAFLAPNLPFLALAPRAWVASLLLPVSLPTFPSGVGLIALAQARLLPLWPPAVYAALELLALAALVIWFARSRFVARPQVALVVALLPLLLAWRSLAAYFLVIPTLAVYAVMRRLRDDGGALDTLTAADAG